MRADLLHSIAVYSNPRRFNARARLAREFIPQQLDSGVRLTFVEHAFGDRPFEFAKNEPIMQHVNLVQVRGGANQECWIKEPLIKIGVRHLPEDWQYMAWIDADVEFVRRDWASETVNMLQHHRVLQPWSHSIDLGPNGEVMRNEWGNDADRSFAAAWLAGDVEIPVDAYGATQFGVSRAMLKNTGKRDWRQHYGYAWAIRRAAWDGIGGLPDWLVTGSADFHAALGFAGTLSKSEAYISPGATRRMQEFARRCDEFIKQDIGCVPGTLIHGFHGNKKLRGYLSRKDVLVESAFDPDTDLTYDWQGIPSLGSDNRILRDGLRRILTSRNEDDIRLEG
jgi:hypothetical protein